MGTLISQDIPYSGTTLSQQSTPIGAIIPYMGTTAPSGYLACDGGVYSISLYPLLAGFFETQFGSINYFGGDGTTTFAVPNLQGEFLRGAGTNSHSNQGSGGSVGEHQDGTEIPRVVNAGIGVYALQKGEGNNDTKYLDSTAASGTKQIVLSGTLDTITSRDVTFTSRPTNTSVLYIIKAKSDRLDKITFAEVDDASEADDVVWSAEKTREAIGPASYSTSEQWTGKYWIDGKKIYQKTYQLLHQTLPSGEYFTIDISDISSTIKDVVDLKCIITYKGNNVRTTKSANYNYKNSQVVTVSAMPEANIIGINIAMTHQTVTYTDFNYFVTIQYTKTT